MSAPTIDTPELVFEEGEVTSTRSSTQDKPNRFLAAVQKMQVQETAPGKTYKTLKAVLPLSGETVFIGAAKDKEGNPLPNEERETADAAVVAVRRELDAAGTTAGVTVRKKFELLALDAEGKPNTRKNARHTHFRVEFWTTPKQARKRAAAEAEATAETPAAE